MAVAFCPECSEGVKLGNEPQEGQRVTCATCGADLEVISLTPLELDWAYDEPDEEWDVDDIEFDDRELEGEDF